MKLSDDNLNENKFQINQSSLSNSSRISELYNPFHQYKIAGQIIPKNLSPQDLQDLPFEDQSLDPIISPQPESLNQMLPSPNLKECTPTSAQIKGKIDQMDSVSNEHKGLHQFIIVKTLVNTFIDQLKKKAYIFPTSCSKEFLLTTQERYLKDVDIRSQQNDEQKMNLFQKIPLIPPQGTFVFIWEFVLFLQIMLITFWGPFLVSFKPDQSTLIEVFENILRYLGIVDIFIKLNKSLILQGSILENRRLILIYYIKTDLTFDLFSVLILFINDSNYSNTIEVISIILASIQIYISITRLRHFLEKLQDIFDEYQNFFELTKVLLIIFIFAHITACIWQKIAILTEEIGYKTWMSLITMTDDSIWVRYNYSFYWSTMTMVTVGYGDITPQNPYEMLFCNLTMIVSSAIFGYSLNSIGMILQNISNKLQKYKKYSVQMNRYMNQNQVNQQLQSKVRNYLKFYFAQDRQKNDEEIQFIISKLTSNLRQELIYDIQAKPLLNCQFFQKHMSQDTQKQIAFSLQSHHYNPQEIIYSQDSNEDELCLYILVKGEIQLIEQNSGQILGQYHKGDCFGEYEYFTGQLRKCMAQSVQFSQVFKITRQQTLSILNSSQEDKEKFFNVQNHLLFQIPNKFSIIKCFCCQKSNHFITGCPLIRYFPDLEKIIKRENFLSQQRKFQIRHRGRSKNTLFSLQVNSKQCLRYITDSKMFDNDDGSLISSGKSLDSSQANQAEEKQDEKESSLEQAYVRNNKRYQSMSSEQPHSQQHSSHKEYKISQKHLDKSYCRAKSSEKFKPPPIKHNEKPGLQISVTKISPETERSHYEPTQKTRGRPSFDNTDNHNSNISVINLDINQQIEIKSEEMVKQFQCCDIDSLYNFRYYFPEYNSNSILAEYQKSQRYLKILNRKDIGKYTIYFKAKKFKTQYKLKRLRQVARSSQVIQQQPRRSKQQAKTSIFYQPLSSNLHNHFKQQ